MANLNEQEVDFYMEYVTLFVLKQFFSDLLFLNFSIKLLFSLECICQELF